MEKIAIAAKAAPPAAAGERRQRSDVRVPSGEFGTLHLFGLVVLPFVTGYFLSYYFRTVNAVIATRLMGELSLSAAQLGLMTSAYFLMAALAQLPTGWALDRFGPRRVQTTCLVVAGIGSVLFAVAESAPALFVARAVIGLGVASALLAGLKAIAMVCPPARIGLVNGCYMSIGALGAVAASMPTARLLELVDWRQLFLLLGTACFASAAVIGELVPRARIEAAPTSPSAPQVGYLDIVSDPYFWRLAPLSATTIGGAWALQGLWSAPWLRDVGQMSPEAVAQCLLVMAIALSLGAFCFGLIVHWLASVGIAPGQTMTFAAILYISAELALAMMWPIPSLLTWCMVSAFAAGTVLTYTMSAQHFPKQSVGRANSAFNLLHFGAAFGVQSAFGAIVSQWPRDALGHYPQEAYSSALLCVIALQLPPLLWFLLRPQSAGEPQQKSRTSRLLPRAMVCALLIYAAYLGLPPLRKHLASHASSAQSEVVARSDLARLDSLEERLRDLDARLERQDRQLTELRTRHKSLERELLGLSSLDEMGDAMLRLSDDMSGLSSRVERLERR